MGRRFESYWDRQVNEKERIIMTDEQLEKKANSLIDLFVSFCDDAELDKYLIDDNNLTESGKDLLAKIKDNLKTI
tara:strand:- start:275 stop:499 length:225 start_codon:yes stop_codon:yes gene_type:complete